MEKHDWYEKVKEYTEQLVSIRSVSPGEGELRVAQEVFDLLCADNIGPLYTACGLDPLEGDSYARQNTYAFLRGRSASTLVLLGHIDTVDTSDYGSLERWSLEPEALTARRDQLTPQQDSDDWMLGRGAADMKSGVAVNIAVMRRLAEHTRTSSLPFSVLLLATPDEENESAGVLQAVHFLLRLREQYGLNYLGVINTDYSTALYPGDSHRYIYAGTVGKLLPSFLCIGREAHAGTPFQGLDANVLASELIGDLSMNVDLCDRAQGQVTAPPVTLHFTDLKAHYDVQLPFAAYFYLNMLTLTTNPSELLQRLCRRAEEVLRRVLQRLDEAERRWRWISGQQQSPEQPAPRSGSVLTYADLYASTVEHLGKARVESELAAEGERWAETLDKRERSLRLTHRLWSLSGRQGPAIIVYYAPPYYPHVPPAGGLLQDAISAVVAAHPELPFVQQAYFPYLSDLSYLHLERGLNLSGLTENMPVWGNQQGPARPGAYSLPLEEIQKLDLPVFNWGPFGFGAHQRDERVLMSYAFETLPQLLFEVIERLGTLLE